MEAFESPLGLALGRELEEELDEELGEERDDKVDRELDALFLALLEVPVLAGCGAVVEDVFFGLGALVGGVFFLSSLEDEETFGFFLASFSAGSFWN